MRYDDPNRPMPGASHPNAEDAPRYRGPAGQGDATHDGYTVIGRRPRIAMRGFQEPVPVQEAQRIEDVFGDMGNGPMGRPPRPYPY